MSTLRLHLVRHGRAADVAGRCIGHTDVPLSADGVAEVEALAARWTTPLTACWSSDLARARETATRLVAPQGLPLHQDSRLREMDFGEWDGRPWAALEAEDGARLQTWMQDWTHVRAPSGEGFGDVLQRAETWLAGVRDQLEGDVLVVTHAGVIRALGCWLLDLPAARAFSLQVDHVHVTTFHLGAHGSTLIRWNASLTA